MSSGVVEFDAGPFDDRFHHVNDWVPQRLVTATGETLYRAERFTQLGGTTGVRGPFRHGTADRCVAWPTVDLS